MRLVLAIAFNDEEQDEIARVSRWIGIHPQANEPSTHRRQVDRGGDVRREIAGMINSITQSKEPVFRSRLQHIKDVLFEIFQQASEEAEIEYWTEQGVIGTPANVLVIARKEAAADIRSAMVVLDTALEFLPEDPAAEE